MRGDFVIKDRQGKFNSVSPDMKLEQTIQRASKDAGGIIGEQSKEAYVAEWNLVLHETHLIEDLFRNLTRSKVDDGQDTNIHHELIGTSKSKAFNDMVKRASGVIGSQGNMFALQSATAFRNLLTQQNFPTAVSKRVLCCIEDGRERYQIFRKERFIEKTKNLLM